MPVADSRSVDMLRGTSAQNAHTNASAPAISAAVFGLAAVTADAAVAAAVAAFASVAVVAMVAAGDLSTTWRLHTLGAPA